MTKMTDFVKESAAMQKVWQQALAAAKSNATVLITGPTGSGKNVVAEAIHYNSNRAERPFVKVTIPGIPRDLLESELFGHEKGAFTGAHRQRYGMIEAANGGTLFLDEIGDLEASLQAKLHGFIDDRQVRKIGGVSSSPVDVRIIAATSRDLETMVEQHQFRPDLFYRLRVLHIDIPPLCERKEDILPLARRVAAQAGCTLAADTTRLLLSHHWPGNVRELLHTVEYAAHNAAGRGVISLNDFGFLFERRPIDMTFSIIPLSEWEARNRAAYIRRVVERCNGDKLAAAIKLRCSVATVYRAVNK